MASEQGKNCEPFSEVVTVLKKAKESDERLKKGEWNEGAIHDLLNAYEAKWNERNRGNLRLGDWEDVSAHVNVRMKMKTLKSPTQCKNKIEGMKKKYRSEAVESCSNNNGGNAHCSEWPFFSRMDLMLRCPTRKAGIPGGMDAGCHSECGDGDGSELRNDGVDYISQQSPIESLGHTLHILRQQLQTEENLQMLQQNFEMEKDDKRSGGGGVCALESDRSPSSPVMKNEENAGGGGGTSKAKRLKRVQSDVAMNIKSFAESILKLEQAKMEMYKDTEMLRAKAETRRAEIELRRTQIVMDTQLQIAKLISRKRKANNEPQVAKQNDVVGEEAYISAVEAERQPDLQFGNPETAFTVLEPSVRQE